MIFIKLLLLLDKYFLLVRGGGGEHSEVHQLHHHTQTINNQHGATKARSDNQRGSHRPGRSDI